MPQGIITTPPVEDAMNVLKGVNELPDLEQLKQEPVQLNTGMIMDETNEGDNEAKQKAFENVMNQEYLKQLFKQRHMQMVREFKKIGRNDPCPCGSGKKYKNCCQQTGEYEKLKAK